MKHVESLLWLVPLEIWTAFCVDFVTRVRMAFGVY